MCRLFATIDIVLHRIWIELPDVPRTDPEHFPVALHRGLEIADDRCHLHGGALLKLSHLPLSLRSSCPVTRNPIRSASPRSHRRFSMTISSRWPRPCSANARPR